MHKPDNIRVSSQERKQEEEEAYALHGRVPFLADGEEGVGVLRVELEGLSNVRPAHGARREEAALAVALLVETPLEEHEEEEIGEHERNEEERRRRRCRE